MRNLSSFHWGAYSVETDNGRLVALEPLASDPSPSEIGQGLVDAVDHQCRIRQPMIRKGWLENGPKKNAGGRGDDSFVAVEWDRALDIVAGELRRVKQDHGNEAIFAGNYGWASAGRFHHAKSQLNRFMNAIGGFTHQVTTYSTGAAQVIVPHVLGHEFFKLCGGSTSWPVLARNTKLMVMFGGIPIKNTQVSHGGITRHTVGDWLDRCKAGGTSFVNISPVRDDAAAGLDPEWLAARPNTDVALMLGIAHTLVEQDLHDTAFLKSHCTGFEKFRDYLMGTLDGQPKNASWAAQITGIAADRLRTLAREMAASRTMITVSWSLQRADHGEQVYWMSATLAAMLGQIGLPGGGLGYGYGAIGTIGNPIRRLEGLSLPMGDNPVESFIPVARIADLLLNPGGRFRYNGGEYTYPDTRLVYWCGGNPFHHHQDLNRLVEAWQQPETVVVHEPWWTATARHADIVLPATSPLERNDIGRAAGDAMLVAMKRAIEPVGEARNDYDILSGIAGRLGVGEAFTEGRGEMDWLRHLYDVFRQQVSRDGIEIPAFEAFWEAGSFDLPVEGTETVLFEEFRNNPTANPLPTPSGRIEIFSERIAGFGLDDCLGHAAWFEPVEWLGSPKALAFPLHLLSNQPKSRLHSQLDCGSVSIGSKVGGREPVRLNPTDAATRGITDGDVVRIFNDRGVCLAGAVISDAVRPGCIQLSTGAWYDPASPGGIDRHGNPNVLTIDKGTSELAQGSIAHTALVEVERFEGEPPAVAAHEAPVAVEHDLAAI